MPSSDSTNADRDQPSPAGLKVSADQPYHMLWIADFAGPAGTLSGALAQGVVDVAARSFDELLAEAQPRIRFNAADPTRSGSAMVEINLTISSLKDFDPVAVARQIPAAARLLDIRERIVDRLLGRSTDDDLNRFIESAAADPDLAWFKQSVQWTAAPPSASDDVVDDVLSQIDLGGEESSDGTEASKPPKSPVAKAVAAAAGAGSLPAEQVAALRKTNAELDRRVGAWINLVLQSPQFKPVEAAWRTLAFLVSGIDFRSGVRLAVLAAPKGELVDRIVEKVIDPVFDDGAPAPAVICADHAFDQLAPDLEMLDELAQHAASLPALAVVGASSRFFGVKHAWQIPTLPAIINLFDQWQYAKWKSLRQAPHARSLAVVFGRCLLREPYVLGQDGNEFKYAEPRVAEKDFLWSNGVVVPALTIARSVAERHWPTAISGQAFGRIEGFKTALGGKNGDKKYGPTDTTTPQDKIEEMAAVGLNAVAVPRDSDDVLFWNGLTAARPQKFEPDALLEVSMPYQLFAGRLAQLLFDLKPHLAGGAPESVHETVLAHVCDWIKIQPDAAGDSVSVQIRPCEDDPQAHELAVTVTPPPDILPNGIPVVMGYRLN